MRSRARLAEWQVKHICTWVGLQAMVDTSKTGGKNPLVEAVKDIDVFAGQADSERDRELAAIRGEKVADSIEDDPRIVRRVAADPARGIEAANPSGSFEAMVAMLSGGPKPAMPGIEESSHGL